MSLTSWIGGFVVLSLFYFWILALGGAKWVEGWKSFFIIDWFALDWTAEQIRLYVLVIWVLHGIWFVLGIFQPQLRLF